MVEGRSADGVFVHDLLPEAGVLYRVARTLTRQPVDAEDLVQETLLRAYRSLDTFDGRYPRAWLLKIMRNEYNRNRRKRPQLLRDPDTTMNNIEPPTHGEDNPENLIVNTQFGADVEKAFNTLPGKYRDVIVVVDVEGLGYADAATALGIPIGTVMSRLHRARKQIRRQLTEASLRVLEGRA